MAIINDVWTYLQNAVKNSVGIDRDLMQLLSDKDIDKPKELFQNRDNDVKQSIAEYNPAQHEVMKRPDKKRKGKEPYKVQKLPRAWQRYINEIALFFLLAKPIVWKEVDSSDTSEIAFKAFEDFLKVLRMNVKIREMKRLAGAETESALIFHIYDDEGVATVKANVISMSRGYTLRPLFDQYQNMLAFAFGYYLKENGVAVEHFDILTNEYTYRCSKKTAGIGWNIDTVSNPVGKICAIYCRQDREWDGTEVRINRDEHVDSKSADVNEYFADPTVVATADVLKSLSDPESVGKVVQLTGDKSRFEYVEPPTSVELKDFEKKTLRDSILMDSFTPDFTYENMKGTGTLSGEALRRALILGFIKRDLRMEIYDEIVDRLKNVILAIMSNITHVALKSSIAQLNIQHEFSEPFTDDSNSVWRAVGQAYSDGIMSLETAISLLGIANPIDELNRIKTERMEKEESIMYPIG